MDRRPSPEVRRLQPRLLPRLLPLALAALAAASVALANDAGPDWSGWYSDADGLLEAVRAYQEEPKPIFVYFYTDWCGYCRQFERELLSRSAVDDYLDGILAVRINAENGPIEAQISQRYRVGGFPALFVHSSESKSVSRIERVEMVRGRPKLLGADEFIDALKVAGAR